MANKYKPSGPRPTGQISRQLKVRVASPGRVEQTFEHPARVTFLRQLADGLERLFAPHCEVVIHDFADLERSIVYVGGRLSGREVGGSATDLLLQKVRTGDTARDLHCYRTTLDNGRVLKSSTLFLRDQQGRATGALCINYDIGSMVAMQQFLAAMTSSGADESITETLTDDVTRTIGGIITETVGEMGLVYPVLSKEDKIGLIARLDLKGVFQVKRAVPILAREFGFSRATIYNYLRAARTASVGATKQPTAQHA